MDGFTGYPPAALPLLAAIGTHDRAWFADHRDDYAEQLLEPTRRLVTALGAELADVVPGLQAVPKVNGSIAPIATDQRFGNLPPYRDSMLVRFWIGGDRLSSPSMFLRLAAESVAFGAGMAFDAGTRAVYREAVADGGGGELADLVAGLGRRHGARLQGPSTKRVPAPYPADHPRAPLLRQQRLQVQWTEAVPRAIATARFVPWCSRRLIELASVTTWLQEYVPIRPAAG